MGIYILNAGDHPSHGKVETLIRHHGAVRTDEPFLFSEVPEGFTLVCVIENPAFEGALVITDVEEFRRMKYDGSGRTRTWLLMATAEAKALLPEFYRDRLP